MEPLIVKGTPTCSHNVIFCPVSLLTRAESHRDAEKTLSISQAVIFIVGTFWSFLTLGLVPKEKSHLFSSYNFNRFFSRTDRSRPTCVAVSTTEFLVETGSQAL